ncbi:hypothetical protein [Halorubrum spindle-shaped virus-BLv25]|nr:hypothetical protein [Halorubrum spindle-shaped virus-BLv25]
MFRGSFLAVFAAILLLFSIHSGYVLGSNADSMKEVESELDDIDSSYQETKEQNLSIQEGDLQDMSKLEKGYYRTVVKPVYWFGRGLIDMSYEALERTAVYSYRNL